MVTQNTHDVHMDMHLSKSRFYTSKKERIVSFQDKKNNVCYQRDQHFPKVFDLAFHWYSHWNESTPHDIKHHWPVYQIWPLKMFSSHLIKKLKTKTFYLKSINSRANTST